MPDTGVIIIEQPSKVSFGEPFNFKIRTPKTCKILSFTLIDQWAGPARFANSRPHIPYIEATDINFRIKDDLYLHIDAVKVGEV